MRTPTQFGTASKSASEGASSSSKPKDLSENANTANTKSLSGASKPNASVSNGVAVTVPVRSTPATKSKPATTKTKMIEATTHKKRGIGRDLADPDRPLHLKGVLPKVTGNSSSWAKALCVSPKIIFDLKVQVRDKIEDGELLGKRMIGERTKQQIKLIALDLRDKRGDIVCHRSLEDPFSAVIHEMVKSLNAEERKSWGAEAAHVEPQTKAEHASKNGKLAQKRAPNPSTPNISEGEGNSLEGYRSLNQSTKRPKKAGGKPNVAKPARSDSTGANVAPKENVKDDQSTNAVKGSRPQLATNGKQTSAGAEDGGVSEAQKLEKRKSTASSDTDYHKSEKVKHRKPDHPLRNESLYDTSAPEQRAKFQPGHSASVDECDGAKKSSCPKHNDIASVKDQTDFHNRKHLESLAARSVSLLVDKVELPLPVEGKAASVIPVKPASFHVPTFTFGPESITVSILDRSRTVPGITMYLKDLLPANRELDIRTCAGVQVARLYEILNSKIKGQGAPFLEESYPILYRDGDGDRYEITDDISLEIYCRFQIEEWLKKDPRFPPRIKFERVEHAVSPSSDQTFKPTGVHSEPQSPVRISARQDRPATREPPSKKIKRDSWSPATSKGKAKERSLSPMEDVIHVKKRSK